MENLELMPSESSLLFDFVSECLSSIETYPFTGKHVLPDFIKFDLRLVDCDDLFSLYSKLD